MMRCIVSGFISKDFSETQGGAKKKSAGPNRILSTLAGNLELLASVMLARFIVWRELRRRKHERRASA